jgi:15-cis-phytoene synthase
VSLTEYSRTAEAGQEPEGLASDQSTLAPGLRLLPSDVRGDVYRLYDVLRKLDDLVDEDRPEAAQRLSAVEAWTHGEDADTYETRILTDLEQRHQLPQQALLEFCQGMRHDIARAVIHTEEELELYCQRAGGSVGIMLARLLGSARPEAETKMAILGRAMQRTNILRDIDEDATHNRLYIAQSTIERFGAPTPGARADLIRDQIARADSLYEQAAVATSLLASGRRGMTLCTTLYREILRQIEREGNGRTPGRAVVPVWRRRLLIAKHHLQPDRRHSTLASARP